MDKELLKLFNADSLNEDQQKAITEKINDIIDLKVNEKIEEKLKEKSDELLEHYEQKFEEYKTDLVGKFSNFVDTVIEEELQIPEYIVEFARKGELYSDLIEQFKIRIGIDEGVLDDEARNLLAEARDEIVKLQKELNETLEESMQREKDAQDFAAELYKHTLSEGLTVDQKTKVMALLEGVTSKKDIDRKFKLISENDLFESDKEKDDLNEDGKGVTDTKVDEKKEEVKSLFSVYKDKWITTIKEGK